MQVVRPYRISYKNKLFLDVSFSSKFLNQKEKKVIENILVRVNNFGQITEEELEAGRKFLRRCFGKDVKVEVLVNAFFPKTRKPSEVRMGKGKGKISSWIVPIRAGQVIYKLIGLKSFNNLESISLKLSKKFSKNFCMFVRPKVQAMENVLVKEENKLVNVI